MYNPEIMYTYVHNHSVTSLWGSHQMQINNFLLVRTKTNRGEIFITELCIADFFPGLYWIALEEYSLTYHDPEHGAVEKAQHLSPHWGLTDVGCQGLECGRPNGADARVIPLYPAPH
jgi:hypothetical protein